MRGESSAKKKKLFKRKIVMPRLNVKADQSIYLRDIDDLTLHGGLDASGNLVLTPVFSGLGIHSPGYNVGYYLEDSKEFCQVKILDPILRMKTWIKNSEPELFTALYPSLSAGLPMPSQAVINHIMSGGDQGDISRDVVVAQLSNANRKRQIRNFKFWGWRITKPLETVPKILDLEAEYPGLLSDPFREVLEMVQEFGSAIEQAESQGQFVAMITGELAFTREMVDYHRRSEPDTFHSNAWVQFYKWLQNFDADIGRNFLAGKERLSNPGDFAREMARGSLNLDSWELVPDVGAPTLTSFAEKVVRIQAAGGIWCQGYGKESDVASRYSYYETATQVARTRRFRHTAALGFAWNMLVERVLVTAANVPIEIADINERANVWMRRYRPDSVVANLRDQFSTRPIAEGGVLIIKHQSIEENGMEPHQQTEGIKIELGVPRPEYAAYKGASRDKRFPRLRDRFVGIKDLMEDGVGGFGTCFVDPANSMIWPQGRLWQCVDLARTILAAPHLLACPEVLTQGYTSMNLQKWEEIHQETDTLPKIGSGAGRGALFRWNEVYDWFLGVAPWIKRPVVAKRMVEFNDVIWTSWPLSVIDGGMATVDVRLAVQFEPLGHNHHIDSVAGLQNLMRGLAQKMTSEGDSLESVMEAFAEFGSRLRFVARPYFEVGGRVVPEIEWLAARPIKTGHMRLPSGLIVETEIYRQKTEHFLIRKRVYAKFKELRLTDIWAVHRSAVNETAEGLNPEEYVRQLSMNIAPVLKTLDQEALVPIAQSLVKEKIADLASTLRPYQAEGVAWMYLRLHLGFGVCLADEMGLGKTLQAIALMRLLRQECEPSLVVMPKTLLFNWMRELKRFSPDMKVAVLGESSLKWNEADVWLVTYPRMRLNHGVLSEVAWNIVVLDEAQAIKNADTQVAEAANQLKSRRRLALTGTPVENRAGELWSIINWLNPGYLGAQRDFAAYTQMARFAEGKRLLMAPLRECLDPLILRRLKSDPHVAMGLPDKIHQDVCYDLSEEQRLLYAAVLETVMAEDNEVLQVLARRALFLKAILHIKQICVHPDLFFGEQTEDEALEDFGEHAKASLQKLRKVLAKHLRKNSDHVTFHDWLRRSGKLTAMVDLIDSVKAQTRGILIFTQYRGAAEIIRRALSHAYPEGIAFIHGGLTAEERIRMVDEFNEACRECREAEGYPPVLILSIKAGGTGLNLTGADRVIHFDRWWNPAVEDQATDRAHRMGQDCTVFIHTLTSGGTIEESIGNIFVDKRQLADDLLGADSSQDVGAMLRNREGFLDLVDPQRVFMKMLIGTKGAPMIEKRV